MSRPATTPATSECAAGHGVGCAGCPACACSLCLYSRGSSRAVVPKDSCGYASYACYMSRPCLPVRHS